MIVTDGVLEAMSPSGEQFGLERLLDSVRSIRGLNAREIVAGLQQDVSEFVSATEATDDATVVVVKHTLEGGEHTESVGFRPGMC